MRKISIRKSLASVREYAIYLLLATAGFLLIFGFINVAQNSAQQNSLNKQIEVTQQLVAQVKSLSEENKKLSQTAANYAYCNSVILAKYTQTGDPISIEDLDKCKFTSYPNNTAAQSFNGGAGLQPTTTPQVASSGSTSPSATVSSSPSSPSSNGGSSTPPSNNGNGGTTPPEQGEPAPKPTPLLQTQPVLFLPGIQLYTPCTQVLKILTVSCG